MDAKAAPSLDAAMKVAFCLEGRDKLTKLLQYGSRGLAYYVLAADPKSELGRQLSALYKTAQTSRKAFRLGKSASYYKKLLALADDKALSAWEKYLQVVQNVGMFGFFVYDNMAFLGKAKIARFDADEAAKRGGALWFCANVCGFLLAVHNLNADVEKEKAVRDVMAAEEDPARKFELQKQLDALQSGRVKKFLAVLKVTCDLVVSSNTAGVRLAERIWGAKLHDGIIGPVGCVSALVVLFNTWPSAPKTKPAIEASK